MSNSALVTREETSLINPRENEWTVMREMATVAFKSGMLPSHVKTEQAALFIVMKGRELGIPATYALSNIIVIQGKPTANAELMLALIYRDHGDNAIQFSESTPAKCTVLYKRKAWVQPLSQSYTIEEAKTAGLLSNQTWQKYPKAMLRARCISAVARLAFPDSIGGMYTPEELGAQVMVTDDEQITIIEQPQQPLSIVERIDTHHEAATTNADNCETTGNQSLPIAELALRLVDINAVSKSADGYVITDGTGSHLVQKINGKVGCNCEAFIDSIDPDYQCVHIFAAFEYATRQRDLDAKANAESAR